MTAEATTPHADIDLERDVLGGLLRGASYDTAIAHGLTRTLFFRHVHGLVFDAIEAVVAGGGKPGLSEVGAVLRARGTLETVGLSYFSALVDGAVRGDLGWQIGRLSLLAQLRAVTRALGAMSSAASDPEAISDGTLDTHLDLLRGLVQASPRTAVLTPMAQWAALVAESVRDTSRRVPLGLPAIDKVCGGIRPGEVCGLMARSGSGKTLAVCHAVSRLGVDGRSVLVFSLEMPAAQIMGRLAAMVYQESSARIWAAARDGQHTAAQWAARMPNVSICDTPGLSVREMENLIQRQTPTPELVVIDYLGLIGGDRKLSTYDRVSHQARELKDLAKRCDCAVLLLIQVSREAGGAYGEKRLSIGSARDSGVIEEAMDYLIGVRRFDSVPTLDPYERERQKDILWFSVAKNRHGRVPHEETPYAIHDVDLHLVEQDGLAVPTAAATGDLYAMNGRRR